MKHLTDAELVDLIEETAPGGAVDHVAACAVCQDKVIAMQRVLAEARAIEWPEPSPLFWDHFSARVGGAIATEATPAPPPGWMAWWRQPAVTWAAAASVAVLLMVGTLWRATVVAPAPPRAVPQAQSAAGSASSDLLENIDDLDRDAAWLEVRSAAGSFRWDDAQEIGIAARPGSAERAVLELTAEERAELARLLEDELKRSGA